MLSTLITATLCNTQDEKLLDSCIQLYSDYKKPLDKTMERNGIHRMNHRQSKDRVFTVSEKTVRTPVKGLGYSRILGGTFGIITGPLSSLWDFVTRDPRVPTAKGIQKDLPKVECQNTLLKGGQVTLLNDDTTIDLGTITRGYITDEMKAYLEENGVESTIVNLGGNILCMGGLPEGRPFKIGLQKSYATHTEIVTALKITGMSVVSSGVHGRHFAQSGINYHRILDPRVGYPYENGLVRVSIIPSRSIDGDELSTTCFALRLEKGRELIESMGGIYSMFIIQDGGLHYTGGAEDFLYSR